MEERSQELLNKVNNLLKAEGKLLESNQIDKITLLKEHLLPALKNTKDILGPLYSYSTSSRKGFLGKIKSMIVKKISNIVINVIERQSMKQQKFNELVYKLAEIIVEESEQSKGK